MGTIGQHPRADHHRLYIDIERTTHEKRCHIRPQLHHISDYLLPLGVRVAFIPTRVQAASTHDVSNERLGATIGHLSLCWHASTVDCGNINHVLSATSVSFQSDIVLRAYISCNIARFVVVPYFCCGSIIIRLSAVVYDEVTSSKQASARA